MVIKPFMVIRPFMLIRPFMVIKQLTFAIITRFKPAMATKSILGVTKLLIRERVKLQVQVIIIIIIII